MTLNLALMARRRHSEGPRYREAWLARLTGPAGWYLGAVPPPSPVRPGPPPHPLQPLWGFRGPLRWVAHGSSSSSVAGCTGIALPIPTRYTHPVYTHPVPYPPRRRRCTHHDEHARTCHNTRFGTPVGEPRGVRTHPGFRVPGCILTVFEVYTAV